MKKRICVREKWCALSGLNLPKRLAYAGIMLMLVIQILLIVKYWGTVQLSDYAEYISMAKKCYSNGSWYPMYENIHDDYISAPGLINCYILQLKIFGTLNFNMLINMLLNLGIIAMLFSFSKKYYSETVAWWSVLIYSILYSTWWIVVPAGTEVIFLALSLFGIWILLNGKPGYAIAAGMCFALSDWVRPLAVIFLCFGIFAFWVDHRKEYCKVVARMLMLGAGYVIVVFIIGTMSRSTCGEWITKSSTGGINLAYTANDKAYGGVAATLYSDTTNICYIANRQNMTYAEKDSVWKSRAMNWIHDNPGTYAKLYALKWGGIFAEDAWPDRAVIDGAGMVDAYVHGHITLPEFMPHAIKLVSKSLIYYILLIVFIVSLYTCRRSLLSRKGIWLLLWAGGVAGTCIFAVSPRYHYPFMFVMVMWSAYGLTEFFNHKCNRFPRYKI